MSSRSRTSTPSCQKKLGTANRLRPSQKNSQAIWSGASAPRSPNNALRKSVRMSYVRPPDLLFGNSCCSNLRVSW